MIMKELKESKMQLQNKACHEDTTLRSNQGSSTKVTWFEEWIVM